MSDNDRVRVWVERLAAGNASPHDLERLFTWIRFRSLGYETVKDVGDFAGHQTTRDKGTSSDRIRHWYDQIAYVTPKIEMHGTNKVAPCTKEILRRGVKGIFANVSAESVMQATGMRRDKAAKALDTALVKITYHDGTKTYLKQALTQPESRVLDWLTQMMVFSPAYDGDELTADLARCLVANKLLDESEVPKIEAQAGKVSIFAVEKMHRFTIKVRDDDVVSLEGFINEPYTARNIAVAGSLPAPWKGGSVRIGSTVFDTNCRADDWCAPELLTGRWELPIEIGPDWKLRAAA